MLTIEVARIGAFIFELDGVIAQTASIHARSWQRLFDEFLAQQASRTGTRFVPFDFNTDYRQYVDGKPRLDGLLSFLDARGISVLRGAPNDQVSRETAYGLANRKDRYFAELLEREGIQVSGPSVTLLRNVRRRGARLAIVTSGHHCADILRVSRLGAVFHARVDGSDLDYFGLRDKPSPDMFLEAAKRLGVSPKQSVVFENTIAGVAAARAGHFGLVIGVGPGHRAAALAENGADKVIDNLSEVALQGYSRLRHFE